MRVLERGVYRGPNIYSLRPMVRFMLDLGPLEQRPSNTIDGFTERLLTLLPSVGQHHCSLGVPGGFERRLRDGTWLGHVTEHVALELQTLAGETTVHKGKTRSVPKRPGVYNVMFEYRDERVGLMAGRLALQLVNSLLPSDLAGVRGLDMICKDDALSAEFDFESGLTALRKLVRRTSLGPTTMSFVEEARRRGLPVMRLDEFSLVQIGYGRAAKRIRASITEGTSHLGVTAAGDKNLTKSLLADIGVPVPRGVVVKDVEEAVRAASRLGFPVVTKPLDGNHGRGVSVNLKDASEVRAGFELAASVSPSVIVEQFFVGDDHRILVVGGQVIAAARRVPAHVVGDGTRTVQELVDEVNRDPRRGDGHEQVMTKIKIDRSVRELLREQGLSLRDVPEAGRHVRLRGTANLSTGGTAIDVTDAMHPENAMMARRAALAVGLDVAGIDFLAPDITRSVRETGGGIVEVNAAPGFRMHLQPSEGTPRNVAKPVLDLLKPGRIPILAVTGTNGKSTTARMIAHVYASSGKIVGFTSTTGVYVGGERVTTGDATGPKSARIVLRDPLVEVAVLETARGGMLREGLGYDFADVGGVLNVSADHLGLGGILTLEQLAWAKSLVARAVRRRGCTVLNADDPHTVRMARRAGGRVAFFSQRPDANIVRGHIEQGGLAVVREGEDIVVYRHGEREVLMSVCDIPATLAGLARFNVENALAATAMCVGQGLALDVVRRGLSTFTSSFEQNPGRLNFFDELPFRVLLDYAHNPASLEAQRELLHSLRTPGGRLIGMVSVPGDRRDDDIREVGTIAARTFDEIVFREGPDGRGRPRGEVMDLLREGALSAGSEQEHLRLVLEEQDAVEETLRLGRPGDLVVIMPTKVDEVWAQIRSFRPNVEVHGD
ncbi:cyanophycin synthetase [Deinococcus yavapaiensis KR-236]|uniref:Cyanophycin synthetase n=2 Tax=Deinococcus TaxID=1298 RepID=A0A318SF84_9DEIO|nr:cyanophycin synthetase [Deinococcus yavapaiensis KR-236]